MRKWVVATALFKINDKTSIRNEQGKIVRYVFKTSGISGWYLYNLLQKFEGYNLKNVNMLWGSKPYYDKSKYVTRYFDEKSAPIFYESASYIYQYKDGGYPSDSVIWENKVRLEILKLRASVKNVRK